MLMRTTETSLALRWDSGGTPPATVPAVSTPCHGNSGSSRQRRQRAALLLFLSMTRLCHGEVEERAPNGHRPPSTSPSHPPLTFTDFHHHGVRSLTRSCAPFTANGRRSWFNNDNAQSAADQYQNADQQDPSKMQELVAGAASFEAMKVHTIMLVSVFILTCSRRTRTTTTRTATTTPLRRSRTFNIRAAIVTLETHRHDRAAAAGAFLDREGQKFAFDRESANVCADLCNMNPH
jgi:hypothetical protein